MMNFICASNVLTTKPSPPSVRLTDAQQKNNKYGKDANLLLSAQQRLDAAIHSLPPVASAAFQNKLKRAVNIFKQRYAGQKWRDMCRDMVQSNKSKLSKIYINPTLQRDLMINWALSNFEDFDIFMVNPIQVYVDSQYPDKQVALDGQHTLITLSLVCTALGLNPDTFTVPVNISQVKSQAHARAIFISNNGAGSRALTNYDNWCQMVFSVRYDDTVILRHHEVNSKQMQLETNDLFLTEDDNRFGDAALSGAVSNVQELNNHPLRVITDSAAIWAKMSQGQRAISGPEVALICRFVAACHQTENNITISAAYVDALVACCHKYFPNGFANESDFVLKARSSYRAWFLSVNKYETTGVSRDISKQLYFLIAQFKKFLHDNNIALTAPTYTVPGGYVPLSITLE
jgi:hypothetical protein